MLRVNEIFLSIQGEGVSTGFPTIFLRLTGCNLRCTYCDTLYAYQEGLYMSTLEVVESIRSFGYKRLCITGGEPLLHEEVKDVLAALQDYEINIETNGSINLNGWSLSDNHRFTMDAKTPSSGEEKTVCYTNFQRLRDQDEVKFVIANQGDYVWAKEVLKKYYHKGIVTFSPVYGAIDANVLIQWILDDKLDVRFQLQLHKIIWPVDMKGV